MAENAQLQFLWKQISERAEKIINPVSFNHLIKDLEPVDLMGRKIVLKCSSDINANSIMKKFSDKLKDTVVVYGASDEAENSFDVFHIFIFPRFSQMKGYRISSAPRARGQSGRRPRGV